MASTPDPSPNCLAKDPGDSNSFGSALAISEDYLAVGDPGANRVALYSRGVDDRWSRIGEIYPPEGSAAEKVGAGFGYDLALDHDKLVVGAYQEILSGVAPRTQESNTRTFVSGIFFVDLEADNVTSLVPKQIPSDAFPKDTVYGFDVSIDGSTIAFGLRQEKSPGMWYGYVGILRTEMSSQEIEIIAPPEGEAALNFGIRTDVAKHLLIAAAPRAGTNGGAYLLNLNNTREWQQLLKDEDTPANGWFGGDVALSKNMALLGGNRGGPLVTTSAAIMISDGKTSNVRYVVPGGRVAVHDDFGVIASAPPIGTLVMPPVTLEAENFPSLTIVHQSHTKSVVLADPHSGDAVHNIQTIAVNNKFLAVSHKNENRGCKVFTVSRDYLLSVSRLNSLTNKTN